MNSRLIALILFFGMLLSSSIVQAQVETITEDELKKIQRKMDKQKEAARVQKAERAAVGPEKMQKDNPVDDTEKPFSQENANDVHAVALDYLSFITAVYAKTKAIPTSEAALKKHAPKDFKGFEDAISNIAGPPHHFWLSYENSKLRVNYKRKPLLTYSMAKVEADDIFWRCKVANKTLSKQIDRDDPFDPPILVNIGGEDCRKTAVSVPTIYQLSN